jgi:hypothetical protein
MIHQDVSKSVVEASRAKVAQQNCIIGKGKFLAKFQIFKWTNKACVREKLPLGSLGSKQLATSESSFAKTVVFQLLKSADAKLRHPVTITNCTLLGFIKVHLVKLSYRKN